MSPHRYYMCETSAFDADANQAPCTLGDLGFHISSELRGGNIWRHESSVDISGPGRYEFPQIPAMGCRR